MIVDTGYWVALTNNRDRYHERVVRRTAELRQGLVTTWPVLTETCHLLMARVGRRGPQAILRGFQSGAFEVFEMGRRHARTLQELMEQYADLPMDLADASLVVLAQELGHGRILSTDQRDFRTYRWKRHQPFENLLFDESEP